MQAVFGRTHAENETAAVQPPRPFGGMASFLLPKLPGGLATDQSKTIKKERHAVRPPVEHKWSLPGMGHNNAKLPEIFQHELLQHFSFNMFCKVLRNRVTIFVLSRWHW